MNPTSASSKEDPYTNQMREIIKLNEPYFRQKISLKQTCKPDDQRLKIPSSLGVTTYCHDFKKKSYKSEDFSQTQDFSGKNLHFTFNGQSTYQNQFKRPKIESNRRKRRKSVKKCEKENSVGTTLTQYENNYVDWGVKSTLPPMGPGIKSAATNMGFVYNSSYRDQFKGKSTRPASPFLNKSVSQNIRKSSIPFSTTAQKEYCSKKMMGSNNFKPKNETVDIGLSFKAKTQYQNEFLGTGTFKSKMTKERSLEDLQNLIINI